MSRDELATNVFRITNLESLQAEYSLYRVRGLDRDHEDYYRNRSQIEYGIRRMARAPACVYEDDLGLVAAVGPGTKPVPEKLDLVRATVRLDSLAEGNPHRFAMRRKPANTRMRGDLKVR